MQSAGDDDDDGDGDGDGDGDDDDDDDEDDDDNHHYASVALPAVVKFSFCMSSLILVIITTHPQHHQQLP